jgi:outer membrane protein
LAPLKNNTSFFKLEIFMSQFKNISLELFKTVLLSLAVLSSVSISAQASDLMQVYNLARQYDSEYQSAIAAHLAAQEARPQAIAALLPNLSADFTSTGNRTDTLRTRSELIPGGYSDFHDNAFNIQFTQPLYRKDRWIALEQSTTVLKQADTVLTFAGQSLLLRVSERYFGVLSAADTLSFAIAEQDAFRQQLEQSQQRFQVGLIAITDVEEAKAGFDLARAQVIAAENQLDNAREALREVTSQYDKVVAALGDGMPLQMPEPNNIDAWTETALKQNLELRGQHQLAERTRLEIQRIEAGHLPTLDLIGRHNRADANGAAKGAGVSGGQSINRTTIALQLALPLYQGGSVVSRTRQSRHLYQQSLDEQERIRRSVQRQTRSSFLGVQSGIFRVEALAQAVVSTQSAVEAINAGFQVGTRTTVDVLEAQRNLFRSKRDYSDARYTYILDILRLKLAAGILVEDDLRLINSWLH